MVKVLAITNQKGGVAKTSTAINLAYSLAENNKKVLLIDFDPQGNTTMGLGVEKNKLDKTIYNAMTDNSINISDLFIFCHGFNLAPSNSDLTAIDVDNANKQNAAFILKNSIDPIKNSFDFIIIDCPPSLSILTISALTASSGVIIPVQCEYYALEGLSGLLTTIEAIQDTTNPSLKISGILRTMYDARVSLSNQVSDQLILHFKGKVFNTIIPRNVRIAEAPSHGLPVLAYDSKSPGALSYLKLAREVMKTKE